jgi:hypothetical protein
MMQEPREKKLTQKATQQATQQGIQEDQAPLPKNTRTTETSHTTRPKPNERQKGLLAIRALLDQEIECYQHVEQVMVEKKLCLIHGDAQRLMAIDQELIGLHQELTRLEKDRMAEMVQIGQQHSTLTTLIQGLNSPDQSQFMEARQRLKSVVNSVQHLNENNRQLLDLSLSSIQSSVDLIANMLAPEAAAYGPTGAKPKRKGNSTHPPLTGAGVYSSNSGYSGTHATGELANRLPSSTLNMQG